MKIDDILYKMINEGKMYLRDAWYDPQVENLGVDPNYVFWQKGYPYPHGVNINKNTAKATGLPEGTKCYFSAYMMRHFGGNLFAPYQFTQEDMAATDWEPFVRDSGDIPTGKNSS